MSGFTLVELMITITIAVFLLGGLVRIVQNVRQTYTNQQSLAQLQDAQRFAMTVITDVVQAGGYFPTPVTESAAFSFPAVAPFVTAGQPFFGTHVGGLTPDTLQVRYRTAINDGVILCDGSTNTTTAPDQVYTNVFTVLPAAGALPGQLFCQVNNGGVFPERPGRGPGPGRAEHGHLLRREAEPAAHRGLQRRHLPHRRRHEQR